MSRLSWKTRSTMLQTDVGVLLDQGKQKSKTWIGHQGEKGKKMNALYTSKNLFPEKYSPHSIMSTRSSKFDTMHDNRWHHHTTTWRIPVLEIGTVVVDGPQTRSSYVTRSSEASLQVCHISTRTFNRTLFYLFSWSVIHLTCLWNSFITERVKNVRRLKIVISSG